MHAQQKDFDIKSVINPEKIIAVLAFRKDFSNQKRKFFVQKVLEDGSSVFTARKIGDFPPLSSIDLLIKKCFEIDFLRYKEEHKTDPKKAEFDCSSL